MKKSESYILGTTDPGVKVRARITKVKRGKHKGKYYAHGCLIHAASGLRVDGLKDKSMPYRDTIDAAKADRAVLVGRLMEDYQNISRPDAPLPSKPFRAAYDAVVDKSALCLGASWASTTIRRYLTYFERQVIPRLDAYGHAILPRDMQAVQDELVQMALDSKRGSGIREAANVSVSQYLAAANVILGNLHMISPPGAIPFAEFELDVKRVVMAYEQVKALSPAVRITLAYVLHLCPPADSGIVLGAALMYYGGLRLSEAALPRFGDIVIHDGGDYASYYVDGQLLQIGVKSPPKTDAGYRTVVFPHAFVHLLHARMNHLMGTGFTGEEIANMPVVSAANPKEYAGSAAISTFTRDLMERCGFGDGKELRGAMKYEPLYDANGVPISDPRAYILRRDWCSRLINICGIPKNYVDYMLGHESPDNRLTQSAMNRDAMAEIANAMERFVAIPEASRHPMYRPGILSANTRTTAVPEHHAFTYQADCGPEEAVHVRLHLTCDEPLNSLMICTNGEATRLDAAAPDTLYPQNPVTGAPYDPALYDACRQAAYDILKGLNLL